MGRNSKVRVHELWLEHETKKAYGVSAPGIDGTFWLPKSMIEDVQLISGGPGSVVMPQWLAEEKDLEGETIE